MKYFCLVLLLNLIVAQGNEKGMFIEKGEEN